MGYKTNYDLTIKTRRNKEVPPELVEDLIAEIRSQNDEAQFAFQTNGRCSGEGASWYHHEMHMRAFSKAHPDFLFILHGQGEGRGSPEPDIWNKYFLGGKMQAEKAKMQINPFDPTKLE